MARGTCVISRVHRRIGHLDLFQIGWTIGPGLAIVDPLAKVTMLSKVEAVIGGEYYRGVIHQIESLDRVEQAADPTVYHRHLPAIARMTYLHILLGHAPFLVSPVGRGDLSSVIAGVV